jgi:hypothetical protein
MSHESGCAEGARVIETPYLSNENILTGNKIASRAVSDWASSSALR